MTVPRLASLDFMRALEHVIEASTSMTLKTFDVQGAVDIAVVSDCKVLFPGPLRLDSYGVPPVLVLASDNDSKQLCAVNYLK